MMGGQQAQLPDWIAWLQALSVPSLGLFAAWIGYQQWRTAARKVQLDLYDRRFAIYDQARDALFPIMRSGKSTFDDIGAFATAVSNARFMFGNDVVEKFDRIQIALGELMMHSDSMNSGPPYKQEDITGRRDRSLEISTFFNDLPDIILPYMRLDHKADGNLELFSALPTRIAGSMNRIVGYSRSQLRIAKEFWMP